MIITPMSSIRIVFDYLNPFHATDLFWYPLKTSENQRFSDVFRGYQERSVAWNGLKCNHLRHLALKPFENLLPILGLSTKNYRVNLRFQSSVGKYRPEKNFISGHFSRIDYYLIYSYMIADDFKENCEVLVNFFKR